PKLVEREPRRTQGKTGDQSDFFSGRPLRLVSANSSSWSSLIDSYISREAPCSSDFLISPRLAASAAPAAFCCALDVAGMVLTPVPRPLPKQENVKNNRRFRNIP